MVTEFAWRISQVGIVRVGRYFLCLLGQFRIISPMTPETDLHGNEFGRWILPVTGFTVDARFHVAIRQERRVGCAREIRINEKRAGKDHDPNGQDGKISNVNIPTFHLPPKKVILT